MTGLGAAKASRKGCPISTGQLSELQCSLGRQGLGQPPRALAYISACLGRVVLAYKDLSQLDAGKVLVALEDAQGIDPVPDGLWP